MGSPYETLLPPPIERLAVQYFTPLLNPVPVATRLPEPDQNEDTVNGFLRLEAAGGNPTGEDMFFNAQILIHAYSPDEEQAELIALKATGWGSNAQGITFHTMNHEFYVSVSSIAALPVKQQDPLVDLTRYRAMITWRIPGIPLT